MRNGFGNKLFVAKGTKKRRYCFTSPVSIAYDTSFKSKSVAEFNQKYIIRLPVNGIEQISQVIEIIHVTAVIPVVPGLIPYKIDRGTRGVFPS